MALIVSPGDPDADSYVDLNEFRAYCGKVGYDLADKTDPEVEQALRRGTTWLDGTYGQRFIGEPATVEQALEWPRKNAVWRGALLPSTTIPQRIKNALCEAAWRELITPGSLSPDYVPAEAIKQEQVGDLSVTYQDTDGRIDDVLPVISVVDGILAGFIRGKGPGVFGSAARA
ncbi:DnaT-like ssDNA-binding protein [Brucella intermedia]|uniref:DnaT-like ssDNA-binding protein n=1 Tax=Brucella intermedia TaxID=94625 RepID=UPI0004680C36|nr:DnaT-like ssDNA-binding protein [Brucella intermedia]